MFDILGSIVKEVIISSATDHDRKVAEEYDAKNQKIIDRTKTRNSVITGAAGAIALGALAVFGADKLSDKNKKKA